MTGTDAATKPIRPGRLSRYFVAALFVIAVALAARSLAPQTLGETARRNLLCKLQEHYRGMSVSIGRGRFDPEIGLIFDDLRIAETTNSVYRFRTQEMIRIDRLTVVADIEPEKILDRQLPLVTRRVLVDGVRANVWLDDDGQLSVTKLLRMPNLGPLAPRVQVRGAQIRIIGDRPQRRPVDIEIADATLDNITAADGSTKKEISVRGRTDFANDFALRCDLAGGATDLRATIKNAHLSRDLFERLPSVWHELVSEARDLDCICDSSISLYRSAAGETNYRVRTTLHEGRFDHPDLPRSISQLRGVVVADPEGVTIEASQGVLGDAVVRLSGRIDGHGWPCEAKLHLTARGLQLDNQLAAALPSEQRRQWDRLQPLGRIDLDADLRHAASQWTTDATVFCKGLDVQFDKFPYPVQQLVGRIELRDGFVTAESLDARVGGNRMQCAFRLPMQPGQAGPKSFVMATDGPIAIDNTLLKALSPRGSPTTKLETFVRSLRPRGSIHLRSARLTTDAAGRKSRSFDLHVVDGYLRYEKFDYPLHNVDGVVRVEDDFVELAGFRATNANAGIIHCDGGYRLPDPAAVPAAPPSSERFGERGAELSAEPTLQLQFRAANVPIDESLRGALPDAVQQTWDGISPSGVLDELNVTVSRGPRQDDLSFDIVARQHGSGGVTHRTLSLRPRSFPYRLDVTGGNVRFDGERVVIDSINARHEASNLSADGSCVRGDDGRWTLLLNLHSGSRLHPDAELIAATPAVMREAMRRLQLRGPVNLRGQTRLRFADEDHAEPDIDWNLALQLEGNHIGDVGPVRSIRGELSIEGSRDELGLRASGEVRIDSLHVHDLQLTQIRGPFAIIGDRLTLGGGPIKRKGRLTVANLDQLDSHRSIQGKIFDGLLSVDGEVLLSRAAFNVDMALKDAQLPTVLADFGHSESELSGTLTGKTILQGQLGNSELLKGAGAAKIRGANLYQLPLIVQILNQLRITPTEDVAFTDGEVEYTIFGDTVTFNEMQLWGDLVALDGGGTLDRRRELDLTFNTRVSPQNTFSKIIRPLKSQKYTLWTIDVKGPLAAPEIQRQSLEGVGETIERLINPNTASRTLEAGFQNLFP